MTLTKKENLRFRFGLQVMLLYYLFSVISPAFLPASSCAATEKEFSLFKATDQKAQLSSINILNQPVSKVKSGSAVKGDLFALLSFSAFRFQDNSEALPRQSVTATPLSFCRFCLLAQGP